MSNHNVITISRQYGSAGHEIGKKLAEKLNIPFYDKEIIALAAKKSGYNIDLLSKADEKPASSLLYSLVMGSYTMGSRSSGTLDLPLNDKLFLIQSGIIEDFAKQGPCVIIGRCANYILQDKLNCTNVFIHSSAENRVKRIMEIYNLSEDDAKHQIKTIDKQRASYYSYYSSLKWDRANNYDLCLDGLKIGIDNAVDIIMKYYELNK